MNDNKTQMLIEFVRRHKELPTLTLAKKFYLMYPGIYKNLNSVRMAIRRLRGEANKNELHRAIDDLKRTKEERHKAYSYCPEAFEEPEGFRIAELNTEGVTKYLVLADLHVKFHHKQAIETAMRYAQSEKCDGVILLGDFVDFYLLSSFIHDPRFPGVQEEVNTAKKMLDWISETLQPTRIVWKLSNHEKRLHSYLCRSSPEIVELATQYITFDALFETWRWNVEIVYPTQILKHEELLLLHGDEYGGLNTALASPARWMIQKAKSCVLFAHFHQPSEHTETTAGGVDLTAWSVGCLCNLHPAYRPLNRWQHGFGILKVAKGKQVWRFENKRILHNMEVV
jgi:predicted phosphodiesterase